MGSLIYVPDSPRAAAREIRYALRISVNELCPESFIRVWCSLAYLFPGLHPDGFDSADSGWPPRLQEFAAEAWRRAETGEIADDQLYPCEAQWAGLCDQLSSLTPEESDRRTKLSADYGDHANG
jgi:hypothetical protein